MVGRSSVLDPMKIRLLPCCLVLLLVVNGRAADDPQQKQNPSGHLEGTRNEAFLAQLSIPDAARFLDAGAHLAERNCYACHSTFTHMAARSVIDPLAPEVMQSRILLERFNTLQFDAAKAKQVQTYHVARVRLLSAVEFARHDAVTTGKLAPLTRQMLDFMWSYQKPDGGINWLKVREAPQAVDDYWAVAMVALGAGVAPEDYAQTPKARAGIEKLRGWFKGNPAQTLHERGLVLMAHSYVGGVLSDEEIKAHQSAILEKQHADGGWSMADLAPWQRKDKKPLDPALTDGYATGFLSYALTRSGMSKMESGFLRAIEWIKTHQRRSGGWFTQSPFARDRIATNSGTSLVIQALEAAGELTRPAVTGEQFRAAHAAAAKAVPPGVFLPEQDEEKNPLTLLHAAAP